jgi:hypothetical protein
MITVVRIAEIKSLNQIFSIDSQQETDCYDDVANTLGLVSNRNTVNTSMHRYQYYATVSKIYLGH